MSTSNRQRPCRVCVHLSTWISQINYHLLVHVHVPSIDTSSLQDKSRPLPPYPFSIYTLDFLLDVSFIQTLSNFSDTSIMPRPSFFKRLFEHKPSRTLASDSAANKTSALHALSKVKASTRARYDSFKVALHINTNSSQCVDSSASADNFDAFQGLPAVKGIGTDLELDFADPIDWESNSPLSSTEDHTHCTHPLANQPNSSSFSISPTHCPATAKREHPKSGLGRDVVDVRDSIGLTSDPVDSTGDVVEPQPPFVDVSHGTTTLSVIVVPNSPSAKFVERETASIQSEGATANSPISSDVVLCSEYSTTSTENIGDALFEPQEQTSSAPGPDVRNILLNPAYFFRMLTE
jgi:hypothetical protein